MLGIYACWSALIFTLIIANLLTNEEIFNIWHQASIICILCCWSKQDV